MPNNISEKAEKACSGCGACSSICPENAIQLKIDDIGFVTASVNESVCIDCGLCKKVCYRFNDIASESAVSLYDSSLFALQSSNGDIVKKCSSGGVAHAIAEEVLAQGGAAVGVAYRYEDNTAIHRIIENAEELSELDGSKYIQSNPHDAFSEAVKQALSDHTKQFAVFGTPCQIAGLNKVLRQKKIKVSRTSLDTLAAMFGCTVTKVYNALAFRSNSESAEQIRQEALQNYGGKEVTEIKVL